MLFFFWYDCEEISLYKIDSHYFVSPWENNFFEIKNRTQFFLERQNTKIDRNYFQKILQNRVAWLNHA